MMSTLAWCISTHTSSMASIYLIPIQEDVVVSSKCAVSQIYCSIFPLISSTSAFSWLLGSLFSSFVILDLYSALTVSILTASAWAHTTTFYIVSKIEASGSSCISGSSEHNSTMAFFKLASSCFFCTTTAISFQYLFCTWSLSYFSSIYYFCKQCFLSLNSSAICV